MINHVATQLALRNKALSLSVCTTGSATLVATTTGYTRASGSFVTDGFVIGLEITPTGFASNPVSVIQSVTATTITVADARTAEASGAARTLAVKLPASRAWESVAFTPVTGKPYIEERYIPGPMSLNAFGPTAMLEASPMYQLRVYVPQNSGISADGKYADAIITHFAPSTEMTVGSDTLFVRADVSTYRGQRMIADGGWSVIPVTIPCRIYPSNSI